MAGDVGHHREERPRGGPLGGFGRGGAEGAVAGDPGQRLAGLSALRHAAPLGLPPHGPQRRGKMEGGVGQNCGKGVVFEGVFFWAGLLREKAVRGRWFFDVSGRCFLFFFSPDGWS